MIAVTSKRKIGETTCEALFPVGDGSPVFRFGGPCPFVTFVIDFAESGLQNW